MVEDGHQRALMEIILSKCRFVC
ncbi:MAG: hypothetical protein G5663_03945 [Serratia symbiotica]|nr:hypothetical protein [Serratia symbiotica]